MNATLYQPQRPPQSVSIDGLATPDQAGKYVPVLEQVSVLLNCAPELVDVLASGPGYVAYSVFDSEGEVNREAMAAVAAVSGVSFDLEDEDAILCGAVLVVNQ
jgi:hypothetical protein